jgi:hypothetical protein
MKYGANFFTYFGLTPDRLPNNLTVRDGVLSTKSGEPVDQYLRSTRMKDHESVVLIKREVLAELVRDAIQHRLAVQTAEWAADTHFALAS